MTEDSPALAAGIKQGDTILKVDGKDIADSRDLVAQGGAAEARPVRARDGGARRQDHGHLGQDRHHAGRAEDGLQGRRQEPSGSLSLSDFGLKVAPAQDGAGVTVTEVEPGSAAAERGLKAGDVILEVAGTEVHQPSDVRDALKANTKKRVLMLVKSEDGQRFLALPTAKG